MPPPWISLRASPFDGKTDACSVHRAMKFTPPASVEAGTSNCGTPSKTCRNVRSSIRRNASAVAFPNRIPEASTALRYSSSEYSLIFTPSTRISPSVTSYSLHSSFMNVVFPAPFNPTIERCSPDFIVRFISRKTSFSERGYSREKLTEMLVNAGFELEAVYGDMSFDEPKEDEQRLVFVARMKNPINKEC